MNDYMTEHVCDQCSKRQVERNVGYVSPSLRWVDVTDRRGRMTMHLCPDCARTFESDRAEFEKRANTALDGIMARLRRNFGGAKP